MIALVLAAGLAAAEDAETYARLFGPEPAEPVAVAAEAPEPPWRLLAPTGLALVGLGAAWKLRRPTPKGGPRPLDVVWREALGDRSQLVLVDVLDADGERRRLLVGTGGGPPALVADLGGVPVVAGEGAVAPSARSLRLAFRAGGGPATGSAAPPAGAPSAPPEPLRERPPRHGGASGEIALASLLGRRA